MVYPTYAKQKSWEQKWNFIQAERVTKLGIKGTCHAPCYLSPCFWEFSYIPPHHPSQIFCPCILSALSHGEHLIGLQGSFSSNSGIPCLFWKSSPRACLTLDSSRKSNPNFCYQCFSLMAKHLGLEPKAFSLVSQNVLELQQLFGMCPLF